MSVARLDASLLARKGSAMPIANAYANPFLDPVPIRREPPTREPAATGRAPRCRLRPDLHAQLRILAARQGRRLGTVLEAAVADYLAANGDGCPCLRAGSTPALAGADCCLGKR